MFYLKDVSVVHPHMLEGGWHFVPKDKASAKPAPASAHDNDTFPNATSDPLFGSSHLRDLYFKAEPDYSARFTVPVVWDKKENTIVNNESSEIIRFFNTAFNKELPADKAKLDLYPEDLKKEIDELNEWVYNDINNGVYKSGFASTQEAYEAAVKPLAKALQKVEDRLSDGREFLMGDRLTEADVRYVLFSSCPVSFLFTTFFDSLLFCQAVYHHHPIRPRLLRPFQVQLWSQYVGISPSKSCDTVAYTLFFFG